MSINWVSKGRADCTGELVIDEPIKGILRVRCPNYSSEYTTPKL